MKTQKWMLIASIVLFVGAATLVAFTFLTPYVLAQGPGGWSGRGDGSMFEGGFGPRFGLGRGMMFDGDFGPRFGMGPGGGWGHMSGLEGRWGGPENSMLSLIAEELGMTSDELMAELQAGKTIADVAAEKNVAVATLVDAVVAAHTERLNERVANGQLTQEQADAMLTLMKAHVTERINSEWSPQGRGFGFGGPCDHAGAGLLGGRGGGPGNSMMAVVAEELGLTRAELVTELQGGKTIAEVAAEKNVAVDTLVDAILAPRTARLNELVANGQLTQEEADNRLATLRVDLIDRLNQSFASKNAAPTDQPDQSESN